MFSSPLMIHWSSGCWNRVAGIYIVTVQRAFALVSSSTAVAARRSGGRFVHRVVFAPNELFHLQ